MNAYRGRSLVCAFCMTVVLSSCGTQTEGITSQPATPTSPASETQTATARAPTQMPSATTIPTLDFGSIDGRPARLQLTYVIHLSGRTEWLVGVDFGCGESAPPCLGEPVTLLEAHAPAPPPFPIEGYEWSPSGQLLALAMASPTDDSTDLFLAEAGASGVENLRNLTDSALVWEGTPAWLPDGSAILVHRSYLSDEPDFVAIRPDGSSREDLLSSIGMTDLHWVTPSPAGGKVFFVIPDQLALLLYVAELDGTSLVQITESGLVGGATFSPDGRLLAYCWSTDAASRGGQLMVADLTVQSPLAVIVADAPGCSSPAWSPDGQWIAFAARDGGQYRIQIVRPDGSDRLIVETGPDLTLSPRWRRLPNEP